MPVDQSHLWQLQYNDPITGELLHKLEATLQQENDTDDCSQYSIQDSLLYYDDPKVAYGIHSLKCLRLYATTSTAEGPC